MLSGGLPMGPTGRVGLAVTPASPESLYAMYVGEDSQLQGIYRSDNRGEDWLPITEESSANGLSSNALGGFGWYFGKLRVSPVDPDDIILLGVDLWRSRDNGANWYMAAPPWFQYQVHADKHDLVFDAQQRILLATDGGLYRADYEGQAWEDMERIPTSQFYRIAWNPHRPDWIYGGMQDNGTSGGPDLAFEWPRIFGGDGFQPAFRPDLPEVIFVETQNGGIRVSTNEGLSFSSATQGIDPTDRKDWDMPYIISPHNPEVMYTGTYRVYKSITGTAPFWEPVSEDLTDGLLLHPRYHTITTINESPVTEGRLYVGTVDANVWRTDNAGQNWVNVSEGLPIRYVSSVKPSPDFSDYVYAAHTGYKDNDFIPHLHRSTDLGGTWEDISGDLPPLAINDIYILPGHRDTVLFVGTDGGVYGTLNGGQQWERLGKNMPFIPVYDIEYDSINHRLFAGTHARSALSYPLDSLGVGPADPDTTITAAAAVALPADYIDVFPVPAREQVRLAFFNPQSSYELAILNNQGQLMQLWQEQASGQLVHEVDLRRWPSGWYIAKLKIRHQVYTARILKQ